MLQSMGPISNTLTIIWRALLSIYNEMQGFLRYPSSPEETQAALDVMAATLALLHLLLPGVLL